jgi:hypothetical protein
MKRTLPSAALTILSLMTPTVARDITAKELNTLELRRLDEIAHHIGNPNTCPISILTSPASLLDPTTLSAQFVAGGELVMCDGWNWVSGRVYDVKINVVKDASNPSPYPAAMVVDYYYYNGNGTWDRLSMGNPGVQYLYFDGLDGNKNFNGHLALSQPPRYKCWYDVRTHVVEPSTGIPQNPPPKFNEIAYIRLSWSKVSGNEYPC